MKSFINFFILIVIFVSVLVLITYPKRACAMGKCDLPVEDGDLITGGYEVKNQGGKSYLVKEPLFKKDMSKKDMLKLGLKTSGAIGLLVSTEEMTRLMANEEVRLAVEAAYSRYAKTKELEHKNPNLQMRSPSQATLEKIWTEQFKNEGLMSKKAWLELGQSMSIFANLYYDLEHQPGETFDQYYEKFILSMIQVADDIGIDVNILISSMHYTAVAPIYDLSKQKEDIKIGTIQAVGGAIARHYGVSDWLIENIATQDNEVILMLADQPFAMTHHSSIRLWSTNITTGMMDYEISEKVEAMVNHTPQNVQSVFISQYPEVWEKYQMVNQQRQKLEASRVQLQQLIEGTKEDDGIIDMHGKHLLADFFDPETSVDAFQKIGIGSQLDDWQKNNYTLVWHYSEYPDLRESDTALSRYIVNEYQELYEQDPQAAYRMLMRGQINNPRFVDYLASQSVMSSQLLNTLTTTLAELTSDIEKVRVVQLDALSVDGNLEYDSQYQLLTTTAINKMLLDQVTDTFGPVDVLNKDRVAFYSTGSTAIREITDGELLVTTGVYARNSTIDIPYSRKVELELYKEYVDTIQHYTGVDPKDDWSILQYDNWITYDLPHEQANRLSNIGRTVSPVDSGVMILYYGEW